MSPENLNITFSSLTNGSDSAILIGHTPLMEYDTETKKRTDKRIGTAYEIVLHKNNYEKLVVKVSNDLKASISMEELEGNTVYCKFNGFKARFYRDYKSNSYLLTASADSIILIDDEQDLLM